MPITPYLAHQAFELEVIETMSAAFVAACEGLHLKAGDDPATRFVAEKVIELAQRGVRDPDELRERYAVAQELPPRLLALVRKLDAAEANPS